MSVGGKVRRTNKAPHSVTSRYQTIQAMRTRFISRFACKFTHCRQLNIRAYAKSSHLYDEVEEERVGIRLHKLSRKFHRDGERALNTPAANEEQCRRRDGISRDIYP